MASARRRRRSTPSCWGREGREASTDRQQRPPPHDQRPGDQRQQAGEEQLDVAAGVAEPPGVDRAWSCRARSGRRRRRRPTARTGYAAVAGLSAVGSRTRPDRDQRPTTRPATARPRRPDAHRTAARARRRPAPGSRPRCWTAARAATSASPGSRRRRGQADAVTHALPRARSAWPRARRRRHPPRAAVRPARPPGRAAAMPLPPGRGRSAARRTSAASTHTSATSRRDERSASRRSASAGVSAA